jgi:WD40 repeat protein
MNQLKLLLPLILRSILFCPLFMSGQVPVNSGGSGCNLPLVIKDRSQADIFSQQQEEWLGEIMDKEVRAEFNIIEDRDGYLQKLGERLLAQLPPTQVHYHFTIIDSPELNSFGTTGGHIYIHRRIIAFAQNEDELASVLGHEIGHMVAQDVILHISDRFKQLGITKVGDKQDIFEKWHRFIDNQRKVKSHENRKTEDDEQLVADRVGIYAVSRAGYNPSRFVDFADRLLQTKGNTGTFWSDFFGATKPEAKRLREIIKNTAPLAKSCILPQVADKGQFEAWKTSIIESQIATVKQDLPGLLKKITLQSQLRDDLAHIRFSPDGNYLLAQDGSSVFVLTRQPLQNLFRIDALDAHTAQFSPDSSSVVFYDKELRVEKWDISSRKRVAMHQLTIPDCFQSKLSPSGETLACIDRAGIQFGLTLVDVASNKILYARKDFYQLAYTEYFRILLDLTAATAIQIFDMKFSPDSRYFAIGHRLSNLVYDLKNHEEVHVPGRLKEAMMGTFDFTAPDEIAGIDYGGLHSKLVRCRFPSGEKIQEFQFETDGWLSSTNSSQYLLVRPAGSMPVGIVDLEAKKIGLAFKSAAFDIYGDTFAGEQDSGEIALFDSKTSKIIGKVNLPASPLVTARTSAFSPDGKWLALSEGTRGSLWNLENGERVFFTRGFDGALFDNGQLLAKFALHLPNPSKVFQLDPSSKETKKLYDVTDADVHRNQQAFQVGNLLMSYRPEHDRDKDKLSAFNATFILEAHDIHNNRLLWQKQLRGGRPRFYYSGSAVTIRITDWDDIKSAIKNDPELSSKLNSLSEKRTAELLDCLDPTTGKRLGAILVDTGKHSFAVDSAYTAADSVFVGDSANKRTLVYSLKSGEQKGKLVGHVVTVSHSVDKMLMENEDGVADLYSISTLQPVVHLGFPSAIAEAHFLSDGTLMVLTVDQNVYHLDPGIG